MMRWLFDESVFKRRGDCGDWPLWLQLESNLAHLLFFVSYMMIPIALFGYWRKKKDSIPVHYTMLLFCAFIFLCGLSHLIDIAAFYWAPYRLYVQVRFFGGIVSAVTAAHLPWALSKAMKLRTPKEYQQLVEDLMDSNEKLHRTNAVLKEELALMQESVEKLKYRYDVDAHIRRMAQSLAALEKTLPQEESVV